MKTKESLDLLNNGKSNKAETKSKKLTICIAAAVGMVAGGILTMFSQNKSLDEKRKDTVKTIKKTINNTVDTVADSADKAEKEVTNVIENVSKSTKGVRNDMADGFHEITDEIEKISDHVSKQLNKQMK
ncbi:hypothetical protein [Clostridium aminobutyricum]|uniref:YtxH domain-containing protein n=1 Tax=Clostridium aminobutyricum TaxID=33953 RepID=A0A939IHC5_CLOAM|nr:hypothetical protein [Clostridium aminobutyricum]MBN7773577.1 hypothetical protein [Clostridium aminobutyricum]